MTSTLAFEMSLTSLSQDDVATMLRVLWRIRLVEEALVERYHPVQGPQRIRCPVHLSIGQEATAAGVCCALNNEDEVFSTHRCHAHYLAKGGDLNKMLLEIYGKAGGCVQGRGGSMHLMDPQVGMSLSVPIVSSAIPLAVGKALANKLDRKPNVAVTFFGDAAVEEGVFHESMNFASLQSLPVLFVCENNLYSVYTRLSERQPMRPIADLGRAHDVETINIDGNDIFAIAKVARQYVDSMKSNPRPVFFILDTYRYREHCGVQIDNHLNYRTLDEAALWECRDPVTLAENTALRYGWITQSELDMMKQDLANEITSAFSFAEQAPLPSPEMASAYLYQGNI